LAPLDGRADFKIENTKRTAGGFRNFGNYRLRLF
jgi:hypothetical protein